MSSDRLDDTGDELRITRRRLLGSIGLLVCGVGTLGARAAYLQTAQYERYSTLARQNRISHVAVPPTRGLIRDRNGVLLARNRTAHHLTLVPEQVPDIERTLRDLTELVALEPEDLERFRELTELKRSFQSIPVKPVLTEAETARFAVNQHRFPGVQVTSSLVRDYPQGQAAAHVLGYVGRITRDDLRGSNASQYQGLNYIGKTGLERYYEERLRGQSGVERVETKASGRTLRVLDREPPVPGEDLHLTLDLRLQRVAEAALGRLSGAVVAMEPASGELLAVASMPTFDPNLFVSGITQEKYQTLRTRRDNPLFARATHGQYPPASTIKPFVALTGLHAGTIDEATAVTCPGWYSIPAAEARWSCWKRYGHGEVTLSRAIAESCDVYFYDLAYKLGIDAMHDFLTGFGFGAPTGVDLPGERSGVLPSRAWKRRNRGQPWYHGETVITGIGQGYFLATPMQLARATAIMANRGEDVTPRLIAEGRTAHPTGPVPEGEQSSASPPVQAEPRWWQSVIGAMQDVVHGRRGTARDIGNGITYRMAGKTGTAQVVELSADQDLDGSDIPKELRDHALFVAFAPVAAPRIATAVLVENGGGGSAVAAPIARKVIDAWLENFAPATSEGRPDA